jgi:hypothetical protein
MCSSNPLLEQLLLALDQDKAWQHPTVMGIDLEFDGDTFPDADKEPGSEVSHGLPVTPLCACGSVASPFRANETA